MPMTVPLAFKAAGFIDRVRQTPPAVHCITNNVAQNFTANVLLAIGASPSMTTHAQEIADFMGGAQALVVNLGTLDADRIAAIDIAIAVAEARGLPWVLDPVMVHRSERRAALAHRLATRRPSVIRGNQTEIAVLAGSQSLEEFAKATGAVIVATGDPDHVVAHDREFTVIDGDILMTRVTAMGCALASVIAAFLTVAEDPFTAAAAGTLAFGVAGEIAAEKATGPGSFVPTFLDTLGSLDVGRLAARATSAT